MPSDQMWSPNPYSALMTAHREEHHNDKVPNVVTRQRAVNWVSAIMTIHRTSAAIHASHGQEGMQP